MKRSEFLGVFGALFTTPLIKNDDKIKLTSNSNADYMSFMTESTERMRFSPEGIFIFPSSGNLGMGTTTPDCTARLDINGEVTADNNFICNNN